MNGKPESQKGSATHQAAQQTGVGEVNLAAANGSQYLGQRTELKKILVPIDFTTASLVALEYAASLAARFGSTVHLLHVLKPHGVVGGPEGVQPQGLREEVIKSQARLQRLIARFWPPSVPVEARVDSGMIGLDIVRAAVEVGSDLIILTTHDLRSMKHLVSKHVAEWVLRDSPCPVFFVQCADPVKLDLGPEEQSAGPASQPKV
jgi:nucleotide-binding universal stress UspA family protein